MPSIKVRSWYKNKILQNSAIASLQYIFASPFIIATSFVILQ
jgi:hypothetical protein